MADRFRGSSGEIRSRQSSRVSEGGVWGWGGGGERGRSAMMVIVVEVWDCWRKKLARRLPFGYLSVKEDVRSSRCRALKISCAVRQAGPDSRLIKEGGTE